MIPSSFFWIGGPGRDHEVVLVLAPLALSLGGEDAEHPEGHVAHADHLADRVAGRGRASCATVAPSRQTFSATSTSRAVKLAPVGDRPVAHGQEVLVAALDLGVPVVVAGDHLGPAAHARASSRPMVGISRAIASASSMVRVWTEPEPWWARPGPPKLPEER